MCPRLSPVSATPLHAAPAYAEQSWCSGAAFTCCATQIEGTWTTHPSGFRSSRTAHAHADASSVAPQIEPLAQRLAAEVILPASQAVGANAQPMAEQLIQQYIDPVADAITQQVRVVTVFRIQTVTVRCETSPMSTRFLALDACSSRGSQYWLLPGYYG